MKPLKPIREWRHVFLDTSVIVDYLQDPKKHEKNKPVQKRISDTIELIDHIGGLDEESNPKCFFYISAITLAELVKSDQPDDVAQHVAQIFNTANVVFVDFSRSIANRLQRSLQEFLPDNQKHEFIKGLKVLLKDNMAANVRHWIPDDLKIVATAGSIKRLDVVLTADRNTFYPITEKLEVPCMTTDSIPKDLFGNLDIDTV